MSKWVQKWYIDGSKGKTWTVSIDKEGNYGCSCPVWKFKRKQCHHIEAVRAGASKLRTTLVGKPEIIDCDYCHYDVDENTLYLPKYVYSPITLEKIAEIAKAMIERGYTMDEFRERYSLSDMWTASYLFGFK